MPTQEMRFDFDGLIQLLARNLYSEKDVFIRELIQNAHDSIQRRKLIEDGFGGKIEIDTRPEELRFTVRDNGIGMNREDIENFLSTVGRGATRVEKEAGAENLIGQFGIGFLSAFVVADKVEVRTRKLGDEQGWLWCNNGSKDYELEPCEKTDVGTEVLVHLKSAAEKGVVHEEEVQKVIRHYADMLAIPIHLNHGTMPVNTMTMPWEQNRSSKELQLDCMVYLEKHMRDSVLEVIPVNLTGDIKVSGVLYITRTRTIATEAPRSVRVFIQRMYLCENSDVLPKWAQFVNGIINSPDLTPTAARDNFIREGKAAKLKEQLGDLIIGHLDNLHQNNPQRFSQILRYHDLNIKAACNYYDEFFKKFVHLLEWRTNSGNSGDHAPLGIDDLPRRTISEILKDIPAATGNEKKLPYFSDTNAANQYFRMADAAGTLVVDASYPFEKQLLETYASLPEVKIELIAVDRQDDPNVFRRLEGDEQVRLQRLSEFMARVIRPGGYGSIRVEARRFQPTDLAAVIRSTERSRATSKAEDMLNDPNLGEDLREMAREMSRMSRSESLRLVINADNDLIQKLSTQDFSHPDVTHLMMGVYNNAILHNSELMTPDNARVFHGQFHELLGRSLEYIAAQKNLDQQREALQQQQAVLRQQDEPRASHRIFFLMFPFNGYDELETALREVIEDRWGCQLYIASDRQWDDTLWGNIRNHMDKADAFLAEISEATPNVMFELGAVAYRVDERPTLLLRDTERESKEKVPADIRGFLYVNYSEQERKQETLADYLEGQMRRKQSIKDLLDSDRETYLSPRKLRSLLPGYLQLPENILQQVSERFPTQESWQYLTEQDIRPYLAEVAETAGLLISSVKKAHV